MPKQPIPAQGFIACHGRKPAGWGRLPPSTKFLAQIRGGTGCEGFVDPVPWTIERTRWTQDGTAGDLVAVRLVE